MRWKATTSPCQVQSPATLPGALPLRSQDSSTMALRRLANEIAALGLRCGTPLLSEGGLALRSVTLRGYATVAPGLKYVKSHEWVKAEGGSATVGISDHAQEKLGDVVYVELPEVGTEVEAGKPFAVVESVKAASDVFSPVSGTVLEVNSVLIDDPAKLNEAAFTDGWMVKVKLHKPEELDELLDDSNYTEWCAGDGH